jgi:hypothetical protein
LVTDVLKPAYLWCLFCAYIIWVVVEDFSFLQIVMVWKWKSTFQNKLTTAPFGGHEELI